MNTDQRKRPVVLIVDDSLTVRMDLQAAIEAAGMDAKGCATVAEARDTLSKSPVDLIVLDVLLPDQDGIEFLKELRAAQSTWEIPVMLLSSETEVRDRVRGLSMGANEYIGKPYDVRQVVLRARGLLEGKRPATPAPDHATILVVDDSTTFREALREALQNAGYEVLTAQTCAEGLQLAGLECPHALIVDEGLPDGSGSSLIRRLRMDAALRYVPCLLLTGSEGPKTELKALEEGADDFAQKSPNLDLVLTRLAALLRSGSTRVQPRLGGSSLGPKRVLAVDDSPTFLNLLSEELLKEGYEVATAESGSEALDLLKVQRADCILLDLVMPNLTGKETCRAIKASPDLREIPVIILTAHSEEDAMIDSINAGADDYVAKSNDFEILKARLRAQIRRKHFEMENRRMVEELHWAEVQASEARASKELAETRAKLLADLQDKHTQLVAVNKELESFAYSVSHDLRAPLRAMSGLSTALLEDYGGDLDELAKDYLVRIVAGSKRMGQLIDDLLKLSRLSRTEMHKESVDLTEMALSMTAEFKALHPNRMVEVQVEAGMKVTADRQLLSIALRNLLQNAWKFTSKKNSPRIEVGSGMNSGDRQYFVRDNGAGFDMAYVNKLFGPFQRLHSETEFEGTGIGLATCQRVFQRHGGQIWAQSEVDLGATFFFTLPS